MHVAVIQGTRPEIIKNWSIVEALRRVGVPFDAFQKAAADRIAVRRVGQPADVANLISFLVSEGAGFVSGQVIYVAGGPLC